MNALFSFSKNMSKSTLHEIENKQQMPRSFIESGNYKNRILVAQAPIVQEVQG